MRPLSVCHYDLLLLLSSSAPATTTTTTTTTGECQPVTWEDSNPHLADSMKTAPSRPLATFSVPRKEKLEVGDVNCRFWDQTYEQVNYYSCKKMADYNEITMKSFFMLNPEVDKRCSNVRPHTMYCVNGFLEPLRAYDGKCGPQNKNATCMSSGHGDCCNSETWTCGGGDNCAIGICYEGDCWGHNIYTTDGSCGVYHGLRRCGGKWGNCCDMNGRCGTGKEFCGEGNCQMGECDRNGASVMTTAAAATTTTGTALVATWVPQGCYKDLAPDTVRPLPHRVISGGSSLTIQSCQVTCRSGGYAMAGVENGNQCLCGHEIQDPANNVWVSPTECAKPCTGNKSQTCGDHARMYIYQYAAPERKVWRSIGCYKDLFPNAARTLDTLPIEACHALCQGSAYRYAGLENGNQFWCGSDIRGPAINISTAQSECSTACTENKDQTCGRSACMHIYEYVSP